MYSSEWRLRLPRENALLYCSFVASLCVGGDIIPPQKSSLVHSIQNIPPPYYLIGNMEKLTLLVGTTPMIGRDKHDPYKSSKGLTKCGYCNGEDLRKGGGYLQSPMWSENQCKSLLINIPRKESDILHICMYIKV